LKTRQSSNKSLLASNRPTQMSMRIDALDTKIIRELLENSSLSSAYLAKKLGVPLSTVQRRKTRLERSVLSMNYEVNIQELGWRNAEILMLVENGNADRVAQELLDKFENVLGTSTRINTTTNLAAYVGFRTSGELHELMEKIRAMPGVRNLEWSEMVRESGNRNRRLALLIFNSK